MRKRQRIGAKPIVRGGKFRHRSGSAVHAAARSDSGADRPCSGGHLQSGCRVGTGAGQQPAGHAVVRAGRPDAGRHPRHRKWPVWPAWLGAVDHRVRGRDRQAGDCQPRRPFAARRGAQGSGAIACAGLGRRRAVAAGRHRRSGGRSGSGGGGSIERFQPLASGRGEAGGSPFGRRHVFNPGGRGREGRVADSGGRGQASSIWPPF